MTVPFEEPTPLSPSHVRRFTADDIGELFPTATVVLLDRPRMPWALMEERSGPSTLERAAAETIAVTGTRRLPHAPPVVESLRRAYADVCVTLGRTVDVHLPAGDVRRGEALDIDASGALVVGTDDGAFTVAAGDVVHVRPA